MRSVPIVSHFTVTWPHYPKDVPDTNASIQLLFTADVESGKLSELDNYSTFSISCRKLKTVINLNIWEKI